MRLAFPSYTIHMMIICDDVHIVAPDADAAAALEALQLRMAGKNLKSTCGGADKNLRLCRWSPTWDTDEATAVARRAASALPAAVERLVGGIGWGAGDNG